MKQARLPRLNKPHVKKGDQVVVISGKAKGQRGEVLRVDPRRHSVLVKEVNMHVRHTKPRRQDEKGGIIPMEGPLHISNVLVVCEACNKGVRKVCEKPAECSNYKKK